QSDGEIVVLRSWPTKVDELKFCTRTHHVKHLSARHPLALAWKQPVLVDDPQQIIARHDALLDHLDALIGGVGDGRTDKVNWNVLGLDEDPAFGEVDRNLDGDDGRADSEHQNERHEEVEQAPFGNAEVMHHPGIPRTLVVKSLCRSGIALKHRSTGAKV